MSLLTNFKDLYYVMPFLDVLKNKYEIICILILGGSEFTLKLKVGVDVKLTRKQFLTMINLLGAITIATDCRKITKDKIELSFDLKNKFEIQLTNMSTETIKLIELFFNGTRYGATFIKSTGEDSFSINKKTLRIIYDKDIVVETDDGLKFYLKHMTPGIIVEAFVRDIHNVNLFKDWSDRIVFDIGAECGDTALYYASKGAKVYSFEPMRAHFDAMQKNMSLNPELAKNIIATNAAIGKDGELLFYHSDRADIAEGASFVYNKHGKNARTSKVQGFSLKTVYEKFGIKHIDLLKMDCKGCEFNLTDNDLKIVDSVKIEYLADGDKQKLQNLLTTLQNNNFQYIIFRHEPIFYASNLVCATIYAKKQ